MENANENVKKKSKGLIIGVIVAAIIIIAAVVLFVLQPWATNVATVDNQKITKYEYTFFSKFNMSQFLASISATDSSVTTDNYDWNTKFGNETAKAGIKKSTIEQIQELKIQVIKAKEAGMKLDSADMKEVDAAIDQQIQTYQTRNEAEAALKERYGVTLSELKEIYKNLTLAQKYQESIIKDVSVSDDEVTKYYDENKDSFDKVTVTHILISTVDSNQQPVSEGKKAEAKKKAEELLAKVKAGEDIKVLAEQNSDDKPAVTTKGGRGYQGEYTFGRQEMVTEFEDWAFADRKAGDAAIVESRFGYHVMQFHNRTHTPIEDLKEGIKSSLLSQKQSDEFTKKLDEFKKDAKFSIKLNEEAITKIDKTIYGV